MEWVIIFGVFAAAAYLIYRNSDKKSSGGSFRDGTDNQQQR